MYSVITQQAIPYLPNIPMNENSLLIPMLETGTFKVLHVMYRRMIKKRNHASDQARILEGGSSNI